MKPQSRRFYPIVLFSLAGSIALLSACSSYDKSAEKAPAPAGKNADTHRTDLSKNGEEAAPIEIEAVPTKVKRAAEFVKAGEKLKCQARVKLDLESGERAITSAELSRAFPGRGTWMLKEVEFDAAGARLESDTLLVGFSEAGRLVPAPVFELNVSAEGVVTASDSAQVKVEFRAPEHCVSNEIEATGGESPDQNQFGGQFRTSFPQMIVHRGEGKAEAQLYLELIGEAKSGGVPMTDAILLKHLSLVRASDTQLRSLPFELSQIANPDSAAKIPCEVRWVLTAQNAFEIRTRCDDQNGREASSVGTRAIYEYVKAE